MEDKVNGDNDTITHSSAEQIENSSAVVDDDSRNGIHPELNHDPPNTETEDSATLPVKENNPDTELNAKLKENNESLRQQIDQLKLVLLQKDGVIALYEREKNILEKEKLALKKEIGQAIKEKENIVIRYATKEKVLLDAKKEKETVEKLLNDSKKELKNLSVRYHTQNEEKSRLLGIIDEKCNELKKLQRDNEKLKTDVNNLETKLKWNSLKLVQETEEKVAAEKKLEECHDKNTVKLNEKSILNEQQRVEQEANLILLKHENEKKDKQIEFFKKEIKQMSEKLIQLQNAISISNANNEKLTAELDSLKIDHESVQNSYSQEMLNSARLRTQLDEFRVLQAQNAIKEEKISSLLETVENLEQKAKEYETETFSLRDKESELLSINKEMSEMIVGLQNEIYLHSSKATAIEAENAILRKEKLDFDTKYEELETCLKQEIEKENEEKILLTKQLSDKVKQCENLKKKLDNALGDLEAVKKKNSQVIKELNREISKYKRQEEERQSNGDKDSTDDSSSDRKSEKPNLAPSQSDSETELPSPFPAEVILKYPTKQHLVERILRLQQAVARQTEKIDFLENHTLSLMSEIQKKSKVLQYYMLRDQVGALTSSRSDENKSELSKYGGVMSAIYSGLKGNNQTMTLELSLEINRKLQAVLEDTLLKNITLKENLDVLGLEVDKLTRQIAASQKRS